MGSLKANTVWGNTTPSLAVAGYRRMHAVCLGRCAEGKVAGGRLINPRLPSGIAISHDLQKLISANFAAPFSCPRARDQRL